MSLPAIYYAVPLLLGATVAMALCFLTLQRYREPGAIAFLIGMGTLAIWSFAYAFELLTPTLADKMLWHRLIYMASSTVPAFWLLFLIQQEELTSPRIRRWAGLLVLEPIIYTFLTWTNGTFHEFLWRNIDLVAVQGIYLMDIDRGLGFYLHIVWTYLLVFASVLFFLQMLRRESSTLNSFQMSLLALGVLAPIIANTAHILGFNPLFINLTPFALISMGAAVGWFAFRFDLWDVLPAAHDAVFEGMGDGVVVLTLNHTIIDINPAAQQFLELSAPSYTGRNLWDVVGQHMYAGDLKVALNLQGDTRIEEKVRPIAITVGESATRHFDVVVSVLRDRRQRIMGWILTLSDVTARHELAEELTRQRAQLAQRVEARTQELSQANAELAHAARLKDEFLANMSHELRTPLNTVLGLSEALQDKVYGGLVGKQERALQHIIDSGRHLLSLINDILDVSKIEAGKLQLDQGPVAVDSLCESSVNFIRQSANKKALQISIEVDPTVKIVYGDERRLKQILVNLLSNAVKFTPDLGQIGIQVTGFAEDDVVRFTVWDTGIGIDVDQIPALFKPFVQLDSKLTRSHEGTGLGLALVHRMVDLHGGSVSVESVPKQGSKFIVALPWYHRSVASMSKLTTDRYAKLAVTMKPMVPQMLNLSDGAVADRSDYQILLVEDNETNINTFSDYLTAQGYRITIARSGVEALLRVVEQVPDLILLDIQMPEMDGFEVTRQIRAGDFAKDVPIIALTALAMPGDRERCLETGMTDYLSKPVSMRRLNLVIAQHLLTKPVSKFVGDTMLESENIAQQV